MRTCSNCGVELEENMNFCPLCGEPVIDETSENIEYIKVRKRKQDEKLLTVYQKLSGSQKRKLFWEISGIILFSVIIATLLIDLFGGGRISWSKYPVTACAAIFVCTSLFCFWPKRTPLLLFGSFATTSIFSILLDTFDGDIDWGVKLGVPLLLATYIVVVLLVLIIRKAKEKGFNLIAYSFIASGILCIFAESIISLYNNDNILPLHWSLLVSASILPASALLLFIHYRLKKGTDLRRFFHI